LVELQPRGGYALTPTGREFLVAFMPLYGFAERWAAGKTD
jgi:DNA-binding HxlR family transcriptional regulator